MDQWTEYAKTFINPISSDLPVGKDPRYLDEFSALKAEVEKKSDVDFEKIKDISEHILKENAKDIRVISYLVMALARLDGLVGLANGMAIMHALIKEYGELLIPEKPKAKLTAIRWFQQGKILTFAQSATENVSFEEVESALNVYDALFESISVLTGEPMSWPDLKKWLAEQKKKTEPVKSPESKGGAAEKVKSDVSGAVSQSVSEAPATAGQANINSTTQYNQTLKSLLLYFREQALYSKMFGVACASQWGNLKLPPNDNGKTRLSAPRESSLNRIRNAIDNEQWLEGLGASLDAFMESGGQFLLEIIKNAYDCAKQAGEKETALVIASNVKTLMLHLPKFQQLKFENDDPFVSSVVSSWLEQLSDVDSEKEASSDGVGISTLLRQARATVESDGIQAAFSWLSNQPIQSRLQKAQIEFCKAQLCIEQDRSELALPLLLQLEREVEQLQLISVAPDFAMQVWRSLYRLQKDCLANIEQESKRVDTENHIAHLQSLMCTTDVASAMQWL